ncbi:M56 family metallopeptidase [Tenacibaculum insulae]|uniref:M56 family metallopeptidase n=1 Tax=Tenacibaculum insulae TaxID=2029677 RepID=UPI003AB56F0D
MINYIIQVILFQVLFVAVYDLFLSKETFFTKNRWYLLSTAAISFLLPFIKIPTIQKAVPLEYTILLPEIVLSPQKVIEQTSLYQSLNYVEIIFWCGFLAFLSFFLIKLTKLIRLIISNEIQKRESYKLVLLPKQTKAFSFFKFIFLGKAIAENQKEKIIQHELVHSKQNHSADLMFFEFLKIMMWFNPMIWIYQHRISLVHEYISDAVVSKTTPKENYINNLLSDLFQVESISFINQFYKHSLIKKRIIMITKEKSKQVKQLKYLLLLPLLASMILYTSCSSTKKVTKKVIKKVEVIEEVEDVPFTVLDKSPTFPGCEEGDKVCFNKSMLKFIAENYKVKNRDSLGLTPGKKRIYVQFKIDTDGSVKNIKARAPHPKLKEEAIEMIGKLPKMIPGEKNGKVVRVGYTLPIAFNIE